jgi:anaerobic selenocysteine-containing dehydrogenase
MIDLQVRLGPWGDRFGEVPDGLTLDRIQAVEHGIDLGPLVPRAREMVGTPSGSIELAHDYLFDDLPRLRSAIDRPVEPLVLVSRRHLRSKNSFLHNVEVLVKGKDRCTLLVHPDDAATRGLVDGGLAAVTSEVGSVEVAVEVSDEMMAGVVCLPHGWGHDRPGTRMAIANARPGVNNNLLAPGHLVDPLSGNAVVNGIPVEVSAVSGS